VSLEAVAARLGDLCAGRVEVGVPLAPYTTYRLGGPAALFFEPAGVDDLAALGKALRSSGWGSGEVPIIALGRGSNIVVSDEGFSGVVVRMGPRLAWVRAGSRATEVEAGAATALPQLANWAARRRLTGLEWLVSIPGSVGGAVRMNAGAHGHELSETLATAVVFDLGSLAVERRGRDDLALAYRSSSLGPRSLVVAASFCLRRGQEGDIRGRMERFRRHRAATQPGAAQNAGSVFKNPPGDSAGRLVEAAGFKGRRFGGVEVSPLHANFFVAGPGASAQDVYDLVHVVRAGVRERFRVDLQPEIRFVGRFRPPGEADAGDRARSRTAS
jgi:UDP-N-acetylmuramate dehydrogenase